MAKEWSHCTKHMGQQADVRDRHQHASAAVMCRAASAASSLGIKSESGKGASVLCRCNPYENSLVAGSCSAEANLQKTYETNLLKFMISCSIEGKQDSVETGLACRQQDGGIVCRVHRPYVTSPCPVRWKNREGGTSKAGGYWTA